MHNKSVRLIFLSINIICLLLSDVIAQKPITPAESPNFIRNGKYIIISAANEKVFDVAGSKKDNGANIGLYEHNGQKNQEFVIAFDNSGVFTMKCAHSSKYVAIANNSSEDLTNVLQWDAAPSGAHKFKLVQVENTDMFMIVGINSGKVLIADPNSGNIILMPKPAEEAKINATSNKYWRFSQRVSFKNSLSGKMLDIPRGSDANGVRPTIYDGNNSKNQAYDLISIVNSEEYYIRNVASKKYLGVSNNDFSIGSFIEQNGFSGQPAQKFTLRAVTEYTYRLMPGKTNVVGVKDNSTKNGAQLVLASDQINNCLNWEMIAYNPKSTATQVKEELIDAGKKTKDKIKDAGKKAKDKFKKLFK